MLPPGEFWVDAHEDLACHCQEFRRDIADPGAVRAMITLPGLQRTGVRLIFATLFVPHSGGDESRLERLEEQYSMYMQWLDRFSGQLCFIRSKSDLLQLAMSSGTSTSAEYLSGGLPPAPIGLLLLMEGCDLLGGSEDLQMWFDRGLRMASLTWNGRNRFASGCFSDGAGLTSEGFELLETFSRLGMILDLAHLSDAGIGDALAAFQGPVCSTHSNSRQVCEHERNLTDPQLEQLAQRGGVVGLNLLATFIRSDWRPGMGLPSVEEAIDHVEHIARLCGRHCVGLGSDLDGGLTPENTPQGLDSIEDLPQLTAALAQRGWDEAGLAGFRGGNWWRFLERSLPA